MAFGRSKESDYEITDILVIYDDEQNTCEINRVTDVTDQAVRVGSHTVPLKDVTISTGREGRVFTYKAPSESVQTTKHLAELERNTVLSLLTAYKPPASPSSIDWMKGLLIGIIFVMAIVMAFV